MQLKDYLHYYMGATYWTDNSQGEVNKVTLQHIYPMIEKGKNVRLHLRRLEDMTKEQAKYIINNYSFRSIDMPMNEVKFAIEIAKRLREQMAVAHYLLQQHFDLFGLIDAGLAIDSKTL